MQVFLGHKFIWLMIFNNFRNRPVIFLSELLNECMEKLYRAHLLRSDYNHNVYATAPALTNSFHVEETIIITTTS
jgi:hypothetical protein